MMAHPLEKNETLEEMLRVDHAGEYGAQQIYKGQLAVLGRHHPASAVIERMMQQEQAHLETFDRLLHQHRVRPTLLMPLWHLVGYALGAASALMGEKSAMACTVAVESVIAEHYQQQLDQLGEEQSALKETIAAFKQDEEEHHDIGLEHLAAQTPFYETFSQMIRFGCNAAIAISKRV